MAQPPKVNADLQSIPLVDTKAEFSQHGRDILTAITSVAECGRFILGPQVLELETKLASYVQRTDEQHKPVQCIGVSDCTTGLQMCLMALGIGKGHEVITVPFTWISSAEVVALVGATVVFTDIESDTYVMEVENISSLITERTRAVIAVSLFGVIPDLERIRGAADEGERKFGNRIAVIEDGAQSFGSSRQGYRSCGSPHAILSATSFFPTKPLSCYGDGGAVFTRDEKLADCVRAIRVHGKVDGLHATVGLNARLDTLQAAVILTKLSFFDDSLVARQQAAERYFQLLGEDDRVVLPTYCRVVASSAVKCAYGVFTIRVEQRDEVMRKLKQAGIACAVYYRRCCHQQPVFSTNKQKLPVAEHMCSKVLSLPMHAYLTDRVQARVARELRAALDDLQIASRPRSQ